MAGRCADAARCARRRRTVRRLLQRWARSMVHVVGLERIAEELMGKRKWKLYQDSMSRSYLQPLNNNVARAASPAGGVAPKASEEAAPATERAATPRADGAGAVKENGAGAPAPPPTTATAEDWRPQPDCHFCADGRLDSEHAAHAGLSPRPSDSDTTDSQSDSETPATLTASAAAAVGNGRAHARPRVHALDDVAMALAAAASGSPHLAGFYPPGVSNWYLAANAVRSFQSPAPEQDKTGGEQPLDLSKGSSSSPSGSESKMRVGNNINLRSPPLDPASIFSSDFRVKPRMSAVAGRRTYTEHELQAALSDIQSGKLGTRRAAVIYGIPRSTLRNKVYKLTMERERESHLRLDDDDDDPMDKDLSGAEEEKEVERVLRAPLLSVEDILRFPPEHPGEMLRQLVQLGGVKEDVIKAIIASQALLAGQKQEVHNNGDSERMGKMEKARSESDMETDDSPANVILKIPSFRPTAAQVGAAPKNGCDLFRSLSEPAASGASDSSSPPINPKGLLIKDVIAQSISQKFQQGLDVSSGVPTVTVAATAQARRPPADLDLKRGGFTPPLAAAMSVIKAPQGQPDVVPRPPYQHQQQPKPPTSSGCSTGGKGTRPKRGKYRNYDRDSLVEAVRAVQRGEMSVHRAGSYYGVPHSTLEYKVKERHLMRPRKRDPKPNPVDEKIASLKQNDLRAAAAATASHQDKLKVQAQGILKPPQKFSPTSPNGMKLPIFEPGMASLAVPPPFSFWSHPTFHHLQMEYAARNSAAAPFPPNHEIFASQMMQKIQEDSRNIPPQALPVANANALAKNARQMAESLLDGSGTNGSFLDGIIRSSLESGIPSEEKAAREEKNVAPENMSNKALLDQLCRNSRLTPLSKQPQTDPNSSGDESYRKGASPLNFTTGSNTIYQDQEADANSRLSKDVKPNDNQTIELSNDASDGEKKPASSEGPERKHPRIYLKPDLVKPENLKPEMLVRFQGLNGGIECSAASDDGPQD